MCNSNTLCFPVPSAPSWDKPGLTAASAQVGGDLREGHQQCVCGGAGSALQDTVQGARVARQLAQPATLPGFTPLTQQGWRGGGGGSLLEKQPCFHSGPQAAQQAFPSPGQCPASPPQHSSSPLRVGGGCRQRWEEGPESGPAETVGEPLRLSGPQPGAPLLLSAQVPGRALTGPVNCPHPAPGAASSAPHRLQQPWLGQPHPQCWLS